MQMCVQVSCLVPRPSPGSRHLELGNKAKALYLTNDVYIVYNLSVQVGGALHPQYLQPMLCILFAFDVLKHS